MTMKTEESRTFQSAYEIAYGELMNPPDTKSRLLKTGMANIDVAMEGGVYQANILSPYRTLGTMLLTQMAEEFIKQKNAVLFITSLDTPHSILLKLLSRISFKSNPERAFSLNALTNHNLSEMKDEMEQLATLAKWLTVLDVQNVEDPLFFNNLERLLSKKPEVACIVDGFHSLDEPIKELITRLNGYNLPLITSTTVPHVVYSKLIKGNVLKDQQSQMNTTVMLHPHSYTQTLKEDGILLFNAEEPQLLDVIIRNSNDDFSYASTYLNYYPKYGYFQEA